MIEYNQKSLRQKLQPMIDIIVNKYNNTSIYTLFYMCFGFIIGSILLGLVWVEIDAIVFPGVVVFLMASGIGWCVFSDMSSIKDPAKPIFIAAVSLTVLFYIMANVGEFILWLTI